MDSDLALFYVPPPQMQDSQPCQVPCHCPEPRSSRGRTHQPSFHSSSSPKSPLLARRISAKPYIFWLLSLPPARFCFVRRFLKGVSVPPGWPAHSQEPGRIDATAWLASCRVLGVRAQPHGAKTRAELWGLDFFCLLFSIFPYLIRSCTYSATALARVDVSHRAMLSSLLLPQKPDLAAISSKGTTVPFVWVCFGQLGL